MFQGDCSKHVGEEEEEDATSSTDYRKTPICRSFDTLIRFSLNTKKKEK